MALSQSSKILVSDINTALAGKQNILGYTPVKSVNGTQADSSGNVAISISAPVTSVNGMTGAVTISSVNTATTATKTTTCPNVIVGSLKITLPSGGTWKYIAAAGNNSSKQGSSAGGTTVTLGADYCCIAIRTA